MNIQDLGAIGELLGGITVIASVIYLASQIRHGIRGYQSHTILEVTNHFSNLQLETAKHDNLLKTPAKAERHEPLDALEQRRAIHIISSYLIGFENMFTQCNNKMMDAPAYQSRRIVIASLMGCTGIWQWWNNMGRKQFPADFVADIEQAVIDFDTHLPEITGAQNET